MQMANPQNPEPGKKGADENEKPEIEETEEGGTESTPHPDGAKDPAKMASPEDDGTEEESDEEE